MPNARVPILDPTGVIPAEKLPPDLKSFDWLFAGTLTVRAATARAVVPNIGRTAQLQRITAVLGAFVGADATQSHTVVARVNGTTVGTAVMGQSGKVDAAITPLTLNAGDVLTVAVTATAYNSAPPPADLAVSLWWRWV